MKVSVQCVNASVLFRASPFQIDTKENDVDAVENGRPARPSSSPTIKSQVTHVVFIGIATNHSPSFHQTGLSAAGGQAAEAFG